MNKIEITLCIARSVASRLIRSKFLIVAVVFVLIGVLLLIAPFFTMKELKESGELYDYRDMKANTVHSTIMLMGWMANVIAMVLGSTVVRHDIKDGTIFSVLAKPVSRLQYFIGSALGALTCQTAVGLLFAGTWLLLEYFLDKSVSPLYFSICFSELLKANLMVSLALAFSIRFSPWIAGTLALLTFSGESLAKQAVDAITNLHFYPLKPFLQYFTFPFPSYYQLDMLFRQLSQTTVKPVEISWALLHIADYALVVLLIAWFAFRRQDLSQNA